MADEYKYKSKYDEYGEAKKTHGFQVDEDGYVKVDFTKSYSKKKDEPVSQSQKTLGKIGRDIEAQKPIKDEHYEVVSSTPKLKKNKHHHGMVDRRRR